MRAVVHVTLKQGVLDPQGQAVQLALSGLGFEGIEQVRQGKYLEIELAETDLAAARSQLSQMCERLLANPVIETYSISLDER